MPDSQLNEPERGLQRSFRKSRIFNSLMVLGVVLATYVPIRDLPDRRPLPPRQVRLDYQPVRLPPAGGPLRIAGAWTLTADDPRFKGLSALAVDQGHFLAITDFGTVIRFDHPAAKDGRAWLADLEVGPGDIGRKSSRDAESLALDPRGRGWWVGYEQRHSLWLYDRNFGRARTAIALNRGWWRNRGVEGLIGDDDGLLAFPERGGEAVLVDSAGLRAVRVAGGWGVADAARAPDGSAWLLLRSYRLDGIAQAVAPLVRSAGGYRIGTAWPLPKEMLDNYEGMVIRQRPGGGWRFWLVSDDGHRFMARTLLVALDLDRTQKNARR